MVDLSKSRNITNVLKGAAILFVISAHFSSNFVGDFYVRWMTEYAISFIAIFFVLSGFGIFQSLERRFASSNQYGRVLLKYAYDRAVRIYPLYWLAMLSMVILEYMFRHYFDQSMQNALGDPFQSDVLTQLGPRTILLWLGVPLVRFPVLWFITAIIQCYWLAPIMYFLIRKLGLLFYSLLLVAVIFATLFVTFVFYLQKFELFGLPAMGEPLAFFYKGYIFGNILIFAFGMMMTPVARRYGARLKSPLIMIFSTVFYLATVYLLRFPSQVFKYSEIFLVPVLFASVFFFCLAAVINQPKVPLESFWTLIGKHSYTIYLFHYQFLFLLGYLGLIGGAEHYTRSTLAIVALSPLLLLLCIGIDRAACLLRVWLERHVGVRLKPREVSLART